MPGAAAASEADLSVALAAAGNTVAIASPGAGVLYVRYEVPSGRSARCCCHQRLACSTLTLTIGRAVQCAASDMLTASVAHCSHNLDI